MWSIFQQQLAAHSHLLCPWASAKISPHCQTTLRFHWVRHSSARGLCPSVPKVKLELAPRSWTPLCRDLGHMVQQESPRAEHQPNRWAGGRLQGFKHGCCCKEAQNCKNDSSQHLFKPRSREDLYIQHTSRWEPQTGVTESITYET